MENLKEKPIEKNNKRELTNSIDIKIAQLLVGMQAI